MGRQPLPTNTIIGNGTDQYRIDTVLGPGGFGVTYLAHDLGNDAEVAVKEYFPAEFALREGSTEIRSFAKQGQRDFFEEGKNYFIEEARTLEKFRHPHIVRVLNLFEQFNTAYMVLEFEEGQSLKQWLRYLGRRPSQEEIDRILEPMLDALEQIHSKGMFHRDIAPDNIIIRPSGLPVLIDFGAARNFVRDRSYTIGAIVKHGYSPPEQYTLDTRLQGAWSDIYSLCATIYSAIMGEPPEEAARRQISDTMLPIEQHLDGYHRTIYSPALIGALNAGLALKPKDRPQTIVEFRNLLRRLQEEARANRAAPRQARPPAAARNRAAASDLSGQTQVTGTILRTPEQALRAAPGIFGDGSAVAVQPAHPGAASLVQAATAYPETSMRMAGFVALGVAAASAFSFLMIGGIEHPAGLAATIILCTGLAGAGFERALTYSRAEPGDLLGASAATATMSALALAIYWLALFIWPISVALVGVAIVFAALASGRWVPATMLTLALLHLAIAALLLVLAARTPQKDPYFLPLMGTSLAIISGLMLATALKMRRQFQSVPS